MSLNTPNLVKNPSFPCSITVMGPQQQGRHIYNIIFPVTVANVL